MTSEFKEFFVGMNYSSVVICLFFLFIFGAACNRKTHPTLDKKEKLMPPIPLSTINLPIQIPIDEVDQLIDQVIHETLKDGFVIEEGYKLNAKIGAGIKTKAYQQTINFLIPIDLEIYPKSNWSGIKAYGKIELDLDIFIDIFQNKFLSKSNLNSFKWLEHPKLNLLGLKIPVERLANRFLEKYKTELTQSIDNFFNETVDLLKVKKTVKEAFRMPVYSTEDSIINIYTSPLEIALGPMSVEGEHIILPLALFLENVISSVKPIELYDDLSFSIRPQLEDNSRFSIQARIPLNYLEIILKENFENQIFGSGLSKLTIHKLTLTGLEQSVNVLLQTTGAYKGALQIAFDPVFNKTKAEIQLENFRIKAIEGKSMDKTLFAILKNFVESKVKKEIENGLNNILKDYRQAILPYLQDKEIYSGVVLSGELKEWDIREFNFVDQKMVFNVLTDIKAKLHILRLDPKLFIIPKY